MKLTHHELSALDAMMYEHRQKHLNQSRERLQLMENLWAECMLRQLNSWKDGE